MNKLKQLDELKGKLISYKGIEQTLLNYKIEGDDSMVVTDKQFFEFDTKAKLQWFIADCTLVQSSELVTTNDLELSKPDSQNDNNVMAQLKGVLMENITKVQKDPKYVPQAKTVVNSVAALTNLVKLELQIKREGRK